MSLREVQARLRAYGYTGALDGLWGPRSEAAAVRALDIADAAQRLALSVDPRAVALIKEFEGFRAEAYRDPTGIWTIGYGTTARADVGIVPGIGMVISEPEAEMYLRRALDKFAAAIRPLITAPITPAEFGAFLSLAYNIGPAAFQRSSALAHFNDGDKLSAANAFRNWKRAGGKVLPGLVRRREAERGLFLSE